MGWGVGVGGVEEGWGGGVVGGAGWWVVGGGGGGCRVESGGSGA